MELDRVVLVDLITVCSFWLAMNEQIPCESIWDVIGELNKCYIMESTQNQHQGSLGRGSVYPFFFVLKCLAVCWHLEIYEHIQNSNP